MNKKNINGHIVDLIFVISLLFLFALSALMLIALGSSIYSRSVEVMKNNYESRTAYAYITEKLRQYDSSGSISEYSLNGNDALRIISESEGHTYVTYLYTYEGALTELIARTGAGDIPPQQGQTIMDIKSMDVNTGSDGLVEITITLPDEQKIYFMVSKKSSEGDNVS